MADNVAITPASGATIATDNVGGVQYQRIKLDLGGDGASSPFLRGQQTRANSLPVTLASDQDSLPVSNAVLESLVLTEDGVHVSGEKGILALAVRTDSGAPLAGDGDRIPLPVNSGGALRVATVARSTDVAAVSSNDRADLIADLSGRLIVNPYAIPENSLAGATAAITGTSDTAVIAAQGPSVRIYVTQLLVTNAHATVGSVVEIKDGSTAIHLGFAAPGGGGFSLTFPKPLRLTANAALNAANLTTGANTYVSASGFKAL